MALIEGGARVVITGGPGVSMSAAVTAAAVTKGAAFFHFPHRDDLFAAIGAEAHRRVVGLVEGQRPVRADAVRDVREIVSRYVALAGADPVVRADAILWADVGVGERARTGAYAVVSAAAMRILTSDSSDGTGFGRGASRGGRSVRAAVDTMMAVLAGVGSKAGAGVGFGDPRAVRTVDRLVGVALAGL